LSSSPVLWWGGPKLNNESKAKMGPRVGEILNLKKRSPRNKRGSESVEGAPKTISYKKGRAGGERENAKGVLVNDCFEKELSGGALLPKEFYERDSRGAGPTGLGGNQEGGGIGDDSIEKKSDGEKLKGKKKNLKKGKTYGMELLKGGPDIEAEYLTQAKKRQTAIT